MSRQHSGSARHRGQRGFAMVELTITAPVLLFLMCGTVEFGQYLIQYSTLNDSVRNAARYVAGAALDSTGALLQQGPEMTQGKNLAVYGNIAGSGAALLPGLTTAQITVTENTAADNITVTAAYPYQSVFGALMPTFVGGTIATNYTLKISTTMRAL
jgi:Flp pilus assembly protein TadG